MSGNRPSRSRADRRARAPRPTVGQMRHVQLAVGIMHAGTIQPRRGESAISHTLRIGAAATTTAQRARKTKRTAARRARKGNR